MTDSNTNTAMADFNLFDMLRTFSQHMQYNVGEIFAIPCVGCEDGKLKYSTQSRQILFIYLFFTFYFRHI